MTLLPSIRAAPTASDASDAPAISAVSTAAHALEVVEAGIANTVQDLGRAGHRAVGVPAGGAADSLLMRLANRLLSNADSDAVIEMPLAGPLLRAAAPAVRVALAGDVRARVERADGSTLAVEPLHTITLRHGERLRVGAVRRGIAYLAVDGGVQVPMQLGSRSTYARARLGGIDGRALRAGDRLDVRPSSRTGSIERRGPDFTHDDGPIRVMLGPQHDAFEPAALATLLSEPYRVGRESDRMGMRLEGTALAHTRGADLCSEGVVPGSIQVPGNGLPIILLVEAQTVGGYTKIATVIRADLPRLAHARPGSELRFVAVDRAQALAALEAQRAALDAWTQRIAPWQPPGYLDLEGLYTCNLTSGIIDARRDELPWEHDA
jgi:biotin-dependent carboxylase-like uncharacterized protein